MSADHSGATALVPPIAPVCPSTRVVYPVAGSASPATSGTPRPTRPPGFADGGTPAPVCHVGSANESLMPPPVAPPCVPSFHTVSVPTAFAVMCSVVPPHDRTCGLELGKSTCASPSLKPSLEPLSPEAMHTVTPSVAASANAASKLEIADAVHDDSGPPQL